MPMNVSGKIAIEKEDNNGDPLDYGIRIDNEISLTGTTETDPDCTPTSAGSNCEKIISTATDCSGNYSDELLNCSLSEGNKIVITPEKDGPYLEGVTTFDLVLISQHVIGLVPFNSPYKIIASDANDDKFVTTFDIVEFRKLILHLIPELPVSSWRFVPRDYVFPDPSDPFYPMNDPFPECAIVEVSNDPIPNIDFEAIKVGDVDLSYNACSSSLTGNTSEGRYTDFIQMTAGTNNSYKKGEEVVIDFSVHSPTDLAAWQAGIYFNPDYLQLEDIVPNADVFGMNISCFGDTEITDGKLRALWFAPDVRPMLFEKERTIFTLKCKALRDIDDISTILSLDNDILQNTAYQADGRPQGIRLGVEQSLIAKTDISDIENYNVKVQPNPFDGKLSLRIQTPAISDVEVMIFDVSGRLIGFWAGQVIPDKRENVVFEHTEKWGSGVFTWQVRAGIHTFSGQVVQR